MKSKINYPRPAINKSDTGEAIFHQEGQVENIFDSPREALRIEDETPVVYLPTFAQHTMKI